MKKFIVRLLLVMSLGSVFTAKPAGIIIESSRVIYNRKYALALIRQSLNNVVTGEFAENYNLLGRLASYLRLCRNDFANEIDIRACLLNLLVALNVSPDLEFNEELSVIFKKLLNIYNNFSDLEEIEDFNLLQFDCSIPDKVNLHHVNFQLISLIRKLRITADIASFKMNLKLAINKLNIYFGTDAPWYIKDRLLELIYLINFQVKGIDLEMLNCENFQLNRIKYSLSWY